MKSRHVLLMTLTIMLGISLSIRAADTQDNRIESSAEGSYTFKHYLKHDHVKVHSKDGAVTLTGTVSEGYHRTLARETVGGLPGVKSVDDQIKVKEDVAAENSDAWIQAKVKTALLFHRNVSALVDVNVRNGVVFLKGKAHSEAEKDLTAEYAKDVEGVKDVKNEMTVAGASKRNKETLSDKIDDASVTAQIKIALLSHRSTSALNTHVETRDGVVSLTGKAKNGAEKDLVTKLVEDIDGVKSLNNNMTY